VLQAAAHADLLDDGGATTLDGVVAATAASTPPSNAVA
jgi:hypothetical protein